MFTLVDGSTIASGAISTDTQNQQSVQIGMAEDVGEGSDIEGFVIQSAEIESVNLNPTTTD